MLHAWIALFQRLTHRVLHRGRPPTPELTSLEGADKYQHNTPHKLASFFSSKPIPEPSSAIDRSIDIELNTLGKRPTFERVTSETGLLTPPGTTRFNNGIWETGSSQGASRAETPTIQEEALGPLPRSPTHPTIQPSTRRLSQIQPISSSGGSYTPTREAPSPPLRRFLPSDRFSSAPTVVDRSSTASGKSWLSIQRTTSSKTKGRISAPIPQSFVHVDGAFVARGGMREGGGESGAT